ncbi:MAG: hypothetical protein J6D21_02030 [Clostridia bacterium]|nr:hypothetical protein [Clostridia bacterium]
MFFKTFSTTMKRIFRSPAMLFSIPAILIMLQQRTQVITKNSSPDFLFIQGGYFYQIYSATPRDYIYNQMLFNAVLIPITHCLPIVIAVVLALVLRDFYNSSERDILFATNIPFGKYYFSKLLCAFTISLGVLCLFTAAYMIFIIPQFEMEIPFINMLWRAIVMTLGMGVVGILNYMAVCIFFTAITRQVIVGSAAIVVYSLMESTMATVMHFSNSVFWAYTYFPQGKLWKFFYLWGTPWFEDFLETTGVTTGQMWTCVGVTGLMIIVALLTGYLTFGSLRVKARRAA